MSKIKEDLDTKKKRLLRPDAASPTISSDAKKMKTDRTSLTKGESGGPVPEEEEALRRDPMADLKSFHASCGFIKSAIKSIKEAKSTPAKSSATDIPAIKADASLHFVHMKKLNRLAHFRCRRVRETTNEAKNTINQCHLQLQNLLYEAMHLQKEITKCMEFKSKDEEIELVPVEEFYSEAPESVSSPSCTKADPHKQMLARLEWELEQRKQLASQLTELRQSKETMSADIQSQQDYLETLQPKLSSILQATRPVQDYLKLPYDATLEDHAKARHLAMPLYILYMQSSAYRDACDPGLKVTIQGDVDAAKSVGAFTVELDDDSDSDAEDPDKDDGKKRRRKTVETRQSEKKSRVLKKHPLSVVLDITDDDAADLQLTFNYLMALNIVTVNVKVITGPKVTSNAVSGGDLLSSELLLAELYPGHHGNHSPNGANNFELKRHGLEELSSYLSQVGRPYLWCQWMGGLHFLQDSGHSLSTEVPQHEDPGVGRVVRAQSAVSSSHMQKTVKLLRERMRDRTALLSQLDSLERGLIPIPAETVRLFPAKINSHLVSWKRSTFEDLNQVPHAKRFIQAGLVKEPDMVFTAVIERASAKLRSQVVLTANCPKVAPLFIVEVMWQTSRTALNDVHIMELEEEVNVHYGELLVSKSRSHLLSLQLQRLMMCLDVYLETDTPASSTVPIEIPRDKMMPRTARGPGRSKPYKYVPELAIFTHRG